MIGAWAQRLVVMERRRCLDFHGLEVNSVPVPRFRPQIPPSNGSRATSSYTRASKRAFDTVPTSKPKPRNRARIWLSRDRRCPASC